MNSVAKDNFAHLHTHSEYSLLDGLGTIDKLMTEARRLGQPAMALTDHGVMHGAIEFFRKARKNEIKPIIGLEAYQTTWGRTIKSERKWDLDKNPYHMLLLAKNMTGYKNLLKLSSISHLAGFYGKPRLDHDLLRQYHAGLIGTTGCMSAEIPQLLITKRREEAYERLGWYVETFGRENFFIELQPHDIPELKQVNKVLIKWAVKFGIQMIATNDVHYVRKQDAVAHDTLLCVQTKAKLSDKKRMRLDGEYYLKSRAEMEATFRPYLDMPSEVFDNTLKIAEMCEVDLEDNTYHLPDIEIPTEEDYDGYLRRIAHNGIYQKYKNTSILHSAIKRCEHELDIIKEMGFSVYFLIVKDLCDYARSCNIIWNVRGSGAGSIVAYSLGITSIDPLAHNLIFERFLNPDRVNMPDFDLDFPDDQRDQMIRYSIEKYGDDRVAQIVTLNRMKAKTAIRDVGRAQDMNLTEVNKLAKLVPYNPSNPATLSKYLDPQNEFYSESLHQEYRKKRWVRDVIDTAMELEGVSRHSGIHAAAVIIADKPLTEYTPLMRGRESTITNTVTQYEFPILESIGLLKIDFLGLATLSVVRECCKLIEERHGVSLTLEDIPLDNPKSFELLASGETTGLFQVESTGMRDILRRMQPTEHEHITAVVSLYRPGPLEYIPLYIERMHGREPVKYLHPALEPILKETYGIIVYQEQIIRILTDLAGYSAGEADLVRRAVGKKKEKELAKHKTTFANGCVANGIPRDVAGAIWHDIDYFARYGFNKAHGADYAALTIRTAYLKAHYPAEYMAALLKIERDKMEKVTQYIYECKRMGIPVLPPDVNHSDIDFTIATEENINSERDPNLKFDFPVIEGATIRYGMGAIKNVGKSALQVLLSARKKYGPFKTLEEFCDKVPLREMNSRMVEHMIKVGALDKFGKRQQLLAVVDQMMARSSFIHESTDQTYLWETSRLQKSQTFNISSGKWIQESIK